MTVKAFLAAPAKYNPTKKILLDEDRTVTDGKYRIVFCIISTIWLISCICALYCSAYGKSNLENRTITKNIILHNYTAKNETTSNSTDGWDENFFVNMVSKFHIYYQDSESVILWISITLYSLLLLVGMVIMHYSAIMSPPSLIVMSSTMITTSIIYHIIQYFVNDTDTLGPLYKKLLYWVGPEAVLFFLSILTFLNIMRYKGASVMRDLLKTAFRFYVKCRYLLVVGFLIITMIIVLYIFTSKLLKNVNGCNIIFKIMYSIIYCGSWYLIILTHIFGRMVISAAVASYYWNENDEQSPFKVICQKIFAISKYQFGSACCKAIYTSIWFIPLIFLSLTYDLVFFETAVGYCLILAMLQILTFDYVVFLIGMYGFSTSEASDLFFSLFWKPRKIIALTCQCFWSSSFCIMLPTNCIMIILMAGLNENDEIFSFLSSRSYAEILIISIPITFVLGTIEDARSICIMHDSADIEDKKSLEEPTELKITSNLNVNNEKMDNRIH